MRRWFAAGVTTAALGCAPSPEPAAPGEARDPGTVLLRRLNRAEYDNTVRDLLGTAQTPAVDFPPDDLSHGFDNQAEALSVSPLLLEMWERAASQLASEALRQPLLEPVTLVVEAESTDAVGTTGAADDAGWWVEGPGALIATVDVPEEADWRLGAQVSVTGDEPVLLTLGAEHGDADIEATGEVWVEVELPLTAGLHGLTVDVPEGAEVHIDRVELDGPVELAPPNQARAALLSCEPVDDSEVVSCAEEVLLAFARRAWRRSVEPAELDAHIALVQEVVASGGPFDLGIELAVEAILLSPHFLYRVEHDPDPASTEPHLLTDHELASRLSYFLWSSMPDDTLFALADDGALQDAEVLAEQVERMLDDPKAAAFVDNFGGQWLYIRAVADAQPDAAWFPDWDETLRASAQEEMRLHFERFVQQPLSMRELLVTDFARADARLADHYGYPGTYRPDLFLGVEDPGAVGRGGLLTMTGLLAALSFPSRSSPVLRGKWVLGQLLCAEPPPPPPGVEGLPESDVDDEAPLRERLEQHRADPACAACHDLMDPIGFGLEHYDGIGAWRDTDAGHPIDASGVLHDGRAFDGALELSRLLADDPAYPACVSEKVFTWALGRPPTGADAATLDDVTAAFEADDLRLRSLITALVVSPTFRMRRGGAE